MASRPNHNSWQPYGVSALIHTGLLSLIAWSAAPQNAEYGLNSGTPLILARSASVVSDMVTEAEDPAEAEFNVAPPEPAAANLKFSPTPTVARFDRQMDREAPFEALEVERPSAPVSDVPVGEATATSHAESTSPPNPRPVEVKGVVASREPASALEFPDDETVLVTQEGNGGVEELPRKLRSNPPPNYPPSALTAGHQGRVILNVLVNAKGEVDSATVSQSSGYASLDQAALQAVRGWKFSPGKRDGVAIAQRVLVPVRFSIRNRNS